MVKTTYSLDLQTRRRLDDMARRWRVSRSEALRRAIQSAASEPGSGANETLRTLDELQSALQLDREHAAGWEKRVRRDRRSSAARREGRRP